MKILMDLNRSDGPSSSSSSSRCLMMSAEQVKDTRSELFCDIAVMATAMAWINLVKRIQRVVERVLAVSRSRTRESADGVLAVKITSSLCKIEQSVMVFLNLISLI